MGEKQKLYPMKLSQDKYDSLAARLSEMSESEFVKAAALRINSAAFFRHYTHFDDEVHACYEEAQRRGSPELYRRAYKMACRWNGVES